MKKTSNSKPTSSAIQSNRISFESSNLWILTLCLCGCSINEYGLVETQMVEGKGAIILHTQAPGVHVHRSRGHFSLTIGHFEYYSFYGTGCLKPWNHQHGRPELEQQASVLRVYGLHIGRPAGITIGYQEHARLLELDRKGNAGRLFDVDFKEIENTRLLKISKDLTIECFEGGE